MVLVIIIRGTEAVKAGCPGQKLISHWHAFAYRLVVHKTAIRCKWRVPACVLTGNKPVIQGFIIRTVGGNIESRVLGALQFADRAPLETAQIIPYHNSQGIALLLICVASHCFLVQGCLGKHQQAVSVRCIFPCPNLVRILAVQRFAQVVRQAEIIIKAVFPILPQAAFHNGPALLVMAHDRICVLQPGFICIVL